MTLLLAMPHGPDRPLQPLQLRRRIGARPALDVHLDDLVGYLPLTALFVYLGSRLEELSVNDPAIWLGAAGLIFFVLITRARRSRC